jgi:hypothetical protein
VTFKMVFTDLKKMKGNLPDAAADSWAGGLF